MPLTVFKAAVLAVCHPANNSKLDIQRTHMLHGTGLSSAPKLLPEWVQSSGEMLGSRPGGRLMLAHSGVLYSWRPFKQHQVVHEV